MATVKIAGVDRSTNYTATELSQINPRFTATDGEVGQGSAPVPNPTGLLEPYAGQSFQVLDGATGIFDGFVGPLQRERGESASGDRTVDIYAIGDENAVLGGFRAYKWKRPAETTKVRFLAFLAAFVPWVTDTTWVTDDVVEAMTAKTYTTESLFSELFGEIKDLTGNTAFVESHRAHLHPATVGITGGLAFAESGFDFATTFPLYDPKRSKDPIDLRDDVMVATPKGSYTATDPTAIALYDAGGLKHQSLVVLSTGTVAEATTKANALLAEGKAERITYEFDTGPLTADQLATIPVGCLVPVTSSVLGLTASTQRIAAMTLTYLHPNHWKAHIECGFPVRIRVAPSRIAPIATLEDSFAKLDYGRISGPDSQSVGSFLLQYSGTGDVPPGPDYASEPKTGLMDYDLAGNTLGGSYTTGIKMLGRGTLDRLFVKNTAEFVYDLGSPGGSTFQIVIERNGTIIASSPLETDPGSGLHGWSPTCIIDTSAVAVANGDILTSWAVIGVTPAHTGSIPIAGADAHDEYWYFAQGSLTDEAGIIDGVFDDLSTTSTDPTLVASPDGAGGVTFRPEKVVDLQDDGVSQVNPATVLNFRTGLTADAAGNIDATGGSGSGTPGWFNVKDPTYGAVGDGTTDDRAACQAAATAAAVAGGILYFPRSSYKIGSPGLVVAPSVTVLGEGRESTFILAGANSMNVITITGTADDSTYEVNHAATVSGVEFGANGHTSCIGLSLINVAYFDVRRCTFRGFAIGSEYFGSLQGRFDDCKFLSNVRGIKYSMQTSYRALPPNRVIVSWSTFYYNTTYAIDYSGGQQIIIESSEFGDNGTAANSGTGCIKVRMAGDTHGFGLVGNNLWIEANHGYAAIDLGGTAIGEHGLTDCWLAYNDSTYSISLDGSTAAQTLVATNVRHDQLASPATVSTWRSAGGTTYLNARECDGSLSGTWTGTQFDATTWSGAFSPAANTNIWRPLMSGGVVITDGSGQAVMAYGPA